MNYIRHLNAFFTQIKKDDRLKPSHITLYLALFQHWNFHRFQNPFPVYRDNIMLLSKIGSKNTYHTCLRSLHQNGYIIYHPAPSKYKPVKISIIRLDIKEPDVRQLDLFAGEKGIATHVPDLAATSTDNETQQVPNMGHYIKENIFKNSVDNTPTIDEKRNTNENRNLLPHVPKLRHVTLQEVEEFFKTNNYDLNEAKKFFYYNQSKNWMLTDKIPIYEWKPLAQKWMLHEKEWNSENVHHDLDNAIQYLYEQFLQGERINKYIIPEYADHLQLTISDSMKLEAMQRRINQLSGTNENTELQLWKAYMNEDFNNHLVTKDEPNLIALAKRLAVSKHFQKLKSQGQQCIQ